MSLIFWARTLTPQIAPTFIGNQLGAAAVTTFVVARQLVAYINSFTITATQVFAPRAVALHAKNAQEEQRNLLILGGRFSVALALFFLGGVTAYGEPFIHSWQRGSQDSAIPLLVILYLGELVPISQWITYSVILGMNKQRVLGLLSLLEVVSTAIVTLTILMLNQNLQFIAAGIAVSASVTRGACYGVYGCRLVGVTLREYLAKVAVPVALVACVPIAVLLIANSILRPDSVRSVIMGGVLYTAIFWLFLVPAILGTDGTKELFRSVLGARPRHQLP
jgi:O-antigen/teichoic acid export membrane protein